MSDTTEPTTPQTPPSLDPVGQAGQGAVAGPGAPAPAPVPAPAPAPAPAQWAAPASPPFGVPTGHDAPSSAPYPAAGYAPPAGYPVPPGYAGQSVAPPFVAPGFAGPQAPGAASARPATGGRGLGVVAMVVAIVATVGAAIGAAISAFGIGIGTGREIAMRPIDADFDWSVLAPVRDWVLLAEVSFWLGTALGVWALVQGVIALVKNRGRGAAIAAVVIAAIGPIVFFVVLQGFLGAGFAAGSGIGG